MPLSASQSKRSPREMHLPGTRIRVGCTRAGVSLLLPPYLSPPDKSLLKLGCLGCASTEVGGPRARKLLVGNQPLGEFTTCLLWKPFPAWRAHCSLGARGSAELWEGLLNLGRSPIHRGPGSPGPSGGHLLAPPAQVPEAPKSPVCRPRAARAQNVTPVQVTQAERNADVTFLFFLKCKLYFMLYDLIQSYIFRYLFFRFFSHPDYYAVLRRVPVL